MTQSTNGANATLQYGHDLNGHVTSLTYPDGSQVTRGYYNIGLLQSVRDWFAHTTTYLYNPDSSVREIDSPTGVQLLNSYNVAGALTTIASKPGTPQVINETYGRDPMNQVSAIGTSSAT